MRRKEREWVQARAAGHGDDSAGLDGDKSENYEKIMLKSQLKRTIVPFKTLF
ncbi:hypothetical protein NB231_08793 [Nitrococcus mobilis Nb-231]|uniref:Uncharacterized protein n=1 Tax=Nitrococcus mobilis Nb-231 TaxID=314278 RepID=A4BVU8_9GAMM|nr:hypothetical protein NB231_08793 [Nitrococcus mobilis Nb-231]